MLEERYAWFEHLGEEIADIGKRYTARKRANGMMDFDDLLVLWLRLMREDAEVRELYQRRFQFVLVDEYQDTNRLQAELIDLLGARHGNGVQSSVPSLRARAAMGRSPSSSRTSRRQGRGRGRMLLFARRM